MELVGQIIQRRRKDLGLSQTDVAKKAKIQRVYLSRIECSKTLPSEKVARNIANALKDNSDRYVMAVKKEKLLAVIGEVGTQTQNVDHFNLSYIRSFFVRARDNIKYYAFTSPATFVVLKSELIDAVNRGVSVQVILGKPTLPNLYTRVTRLVVEKYSPVPDSIDEVDYLIQQINEQQFRLPAVIAALQFVRIHHTGNNPELRLNPRYIPRFSVLIDDAFGVDQPMYHPQTRWSHDAILTKESDPKRFKEALQRFATVWDGAEPVDWDGYKNMHIFTDREIRDYLERREDVEK